MAQVGRNLTDALDGFLTRDTKLIVDRDIKFTRGLQALLTSGGVETIFTPPRSPERLRSVGRFASTSTATTASVHTKGSEIEYSIVRPSRAQRRPASSPATTASVAF